MLESSPAVPKALGVVWNWIRSQQLKWVFRGKAEEQISPNVPLFKNQEKFEIFIIRFLTSPVNGLEVLEENP